MNLNNNIPQLASVGFGGFLADMYNTLAPLLASIFVAIVAELWRRFKAKYSVTETEEKRVVDVVKSLAAKYDIYLNDDEVREHLKDNKNETRKE